MKANTIKLEQNILAEVNSIRPKNVSLSAFVRDLIRKEVLRRKMITAAHEYQLFIASNREASTEDQEWEQASLTDGTEE